MIRVLRFNTYLLIGLAIALGGGCKSGKEKDPNKYTEKDEASLRLYLEVNPDGSESNGAVSVGRENPFEVNVQKQPFVTEFQIEKAAVVDGLAAFPFLFNSTNKGAGCWSNTPPDPKASTSRFPPNSANCAGSLHLLLRNGSRTACSFSRRIPLAKKRNGS